MTIETPDEASIMIWASRHWRLLSPFVPLFRELAEMRHLWPLRST